MNKIKSMNNKGFSFMYVLGFLCIIGLVIIAVKNSPQYKTMTIKQQAKEIVPIMKQWIEAQDNLYKKHGHECKTVGLNGVCASFPDGSDLGVHWPSDWVDVDVFTKKETPCGNSLTCTNHYFSCSAIGHVECISDKVILQGGNSALYPLGNQISCTPLHDKVKWGKTYEEEAAICKEISGKEPINMPSLSGNRDYYPL
ncbi:MAG: hypothetical protein K6E94_06615 [Elusimicrobiaceae bacterium]|nr:hypothetical protein [Elusimicrobiaceae bacterium]